MQIIFSDEQLPKSVVKSIFLAGPSPRSTSERTLYEWRDDAIRILNELKFNRNSVRSVNLVSV
jgi:hypothetical protein